jgi:hypothetical protein
MRNKYRSRKWEYEAIEEQEDKNQSYDLIVLVLEFVSD